jgi:ubiquinone/menaquinone biosynthesis C-methylase UbiE
MNNFNMTEEEKSIMSEMEKAVPTYDSYMRKITFGREGILREETVRMAQVKPGDSVLEVGCGTGTLTLAAKRLAGPNGKVYGIDVLPQMIELSRQKAALAGEEIGFQPGSINNIPFPENSFDAVMCSFMIFHMSEVTRNAGISEIYRVLKPEGRLLIVDMALPSQKFSRAIVKILLGFMIENDLHELFPVMVAAGFTNLEFTSAKFRVLGLPILAFVRGVARKG